MTPIQHLVFDTIHRSGVKRFDGLYPKRMLHWAAWVGFLTLLVWTGPATQSHRVRAVGRFWAWQLWRRIVGRSIRVTLPQAWQLESPPWSELAGITAATGLHELHEEFFVFSYLRSGDGVIDVGSNVGIYTVACAALGAKVSSFEPSSTARGALKNNVILNGIAEAVRILPIALGDTAARGALTTDLDVGNHLVTSAGAPATSEMVDVMPLDSLLTRPDEWFAGQRLALVKIDVEGHDEAVLCDARSCLETHRSVVLVETWEGGTAIRAFLAQLGYRVYRFDIDSGQLIEYPPSWSGQANFIAVADDRLDTVRQRLRERPERPLGPPRVQWRIPTA